MRFRLDISGNCPTSDPEGRRSQAGRGRGRGPTLQDKLGASIDISDLVRTSLVDVGLEDRESEDDVLAQASLDTFEIEAVLLDGRDLLLLE